MTRSKSTIKCKNMIKAMFLSIGILIISMLIGCVYYDQPDDYLMNYISSGAFGNGTDPYLVYMNILFGKIVTCFYQMMPTINWSAVLYIVIIGLVFFSLYYLFFEFDMNYIAVISIAVIEFGTMVFLTYTVITYMAMGAFWIYMAYILVYKNETYMELEKYFIMLLMLIIGVGFRTGWNVILSSAVVFAPVFLLNCSDVKCNATKWTVALVILICLFLQKYDAISYQKYESWSNYKMYNSARSAVLDSKEIDYAQMKTQLEEIDISENDLQCLKNWIFADKDVYSLEKLLSIADLNSIHNKLEFNLIRLIKHMLTTRYNYVFIIFTIVFFTMASTKKTRCEIGTVALSTLFLILLLYIRNRPVDRVMIPIYFLGIIGILFCLYMNEPISDLENWKSVLRKSAFSLMLLLTVVSFVKRAYDIKQYKEDNIKKYQKSVEYMENNKNILFVGSSDTLNPILSSSTIFETDTKIEVDNILKLGSWDIYSKRYYTQVKKYDIENKESVLCSMKDSNNMIYVVSENELAQKDMINKFIEEHTGQHVDAMLMQKSEMDSLYFLKLQTVD